MSLIKPRPNAKATPDAVFAACALLEANSPNYTNDDVIAITGGGMSVVAPLVKIYRSHRNAIHACSSLDPAVTITLIENLSKRISNIKAQADQSINELMKATEASIGELIAINTDHETLIAERDEEISALKLVIADLEEQLHNERDATHQARLDLANALGTADEIHRQLAEVTKSYDNKLVSQGERHGQILADALEKQRVALESEKSSSLAAKDAEHRQKLESVNSALEQERSNRLALLDRLSKLETIKQQQDIEHRAEIVKQQESKALLEEQLAVLKVQLNESRELYQNALDAMERENTVTRTAESFNKKIAEVVGKIDSLIQNKTEDSKSIT